MKILFRALLFVFSIGIIQKSSAQVGQSPFSLNGIGDIRSLAQATQFGMAEVGIASPTRFHINNMNPALLTYNRFASFQMGLATDYRSVETDDLTQTNGGALLNNLVFAFPVMSNRWTMSFGLMPLSNVNYNVRVDDLVPETPIPVTNSFEGDGGLVRAYFAHGVKVAKGLSVGLRGSYIFGTIDNTASSFVGFSREDLLELVEMRDEIDTLFFSSYTTSQSREVSYGDFAVGFGLHYRYEKDPSTFYSIGLTFDPSTNISGQSNTFLSRQDLGNITVLGTDTLQFEESISFKLPSKLGIGFSYEKLLKLMVALDFEYQNWSDARNIDGTNNGFQNTLRIAGGVEWIPNINSIDTYFARMSYRFGFSYEESPYLVNETVVNDFGINFGWSFPVSQGSSFDLGFRLGQRGNLNDVPLRERYFKALIGVTINDRWFVRRRFD